jgi:protein phosphatase
MLLSVPENALIATIGMPGSGKSTWIRGTTTERRFLEHEIVSTDHCRYMVTGSEENFGVEAEVYDLYHMLISNRLRHGWLTVADATNLEARQRHNLLSLANQYGVPAIAIVMRTDVDACHTRNASRARVVVPEIMDVMLTRLRETELAMHVESWSRILSVDPIASCRIVRVPVAATG